MPLARFKDLCVDAGDVDRLARFWARALSLTALGPHDGPTRLDAQAGRPHQATLLVNAVPEPRTAKTRVHLDLRLTDRDRLALLDAGATVLVEPAPRTDWWVLADPEGNAFCVFALSDELAAGTDPRPSNAFELIVDSADPDAQAAWWAGIVGGTPGHEDGRREAWVEGAEGFPWEHWVFAPVPEPKTVKNRWHWDVTLAGTDPAPLLAAGAGLLREPTPAADWWVLADPEGNEFCVFAPEARA